jgi:hypothetical protein
LKKVIITQSNYIPWKGYFDALNLADEFIIYDEMQYTKRDWRNRNKIKTSMGPAWLSIPVEVKGKFSQKISETKTSEKDWNVKHLKTIQSNYAKAKNYKEVKDFIEFLYDKTPLTSLSEINFWFLSEICKWMEIKTIMQSSQLFNLTAANPSQRLLDICLQVHATHYISGPAAKNYLEENLFKDAGIIIDYLDYSDYPEYQQLHPPFEHGVTILDLLLNTGSDYKNYMKSFKPSWNVN